MVPLLAMIQQDNVPVIQAMDTLVSNVMNVPSVMNFCLVVKLVVAFHN